MRRSARRSPAGRPDILEHQSTQLKPKAGAYVTLHNAGRVPGGRHLNSSELRTWMDDDAIRPPRPRMLTRSHHASVASCIEANWPSRPVATMNRALISTCARSLSGPAILRGWERSGQYSSWKSPKRSALGGVRPVDV